MMTTTQYYTKEDIFAGIGNDKPSGVDVPVWFAQNEWAFVKLAYQYITDSVSDDKLINQIHEEYAKLTAINKKKTDKTEDDNGLFNNIESVMHYVLEAKKAFQDKDSQEDVLSHDVVPAIFQFGTVDNTCKMLPVIAGMINGPSEQCMAPSCCEFSVILASHIGIPVNAINEYFASYDVSNILEFEGFRDEKNTYFKKININQLCLDTKQLSSYHDGSIVAQVDASAFVLRTLLPDTNGYIQISSPGSIFIEFNLFQELIQCNIIVPSQ